MSCEDQTLVPTLTCRLFGCHKKNGYRGAKLAPTESNISPGFWTYCCTSCGRSYGQYPHPSLPDLAIRALRENERS